MTALTPVNAAIFLQAAGFRDDKLVTAVAIAKAESEYDPAAKGGPNRDGSYDWGLMQINDTNDPTEEEKVDPLLNGEKAHKIYAQAGGTFKPWSTFKSGSYKANMTEAQTAATAASAMSVDQRNIIIATHSNYKGNGRSLGSLNPVGAISDIPSAVAGATNAVTGSLFKLGINAGAIGIGVVLIVLGFFLITRTQLGKYVPKIAEAAAL